jgi:hypothetical protein
MRYLQGCLLGRRVVSFYSFLSLEERVHIMVEVFRREFPADCDVVIRPTADGGQVVVVRTQRPNPTWLRAHLDRYNSVRYSGIPGDLIREQLLSIVKREPGKAVTYYCRLPPDQGGANGSQERKEKVFFSLVQDGLLRLAKLEKSHYRQKHAVYLAENN